MTRVMGAKFRANGLALVLIPSIIFIVYVQRLALNNTHSLKPNPRMTINGLRLKIYESQWIQIFPNLKAMVAVVTDGNPLSITNARHTSIKLINADDACVGGKLEGVIITFKQSGGRKTYGGDFFSVVLRRPDSKTDGVTCEVSDKMNGTYSVSCILPWEGMAIVEAKLIHPSETIFQIMKKYSSEKEHGVYQNTSMLNSKHMREFTKCSVGFPSKRPSELCDYSNPTHGEKRTCLRPPSGECPKVILYQNKVAEEPIRGSWNNPMYTQRDNCDAEISGSGIRIYIKKTGDRNLSNYFTGNISKYSLDPMSPSGWIVDGKWTSIKSLKSVNNGVETISKCVSNKRLYFFGDSTARNVYHHIISQLRIRDFGFDNRVAWSRGRDGTSKRLNMTIQYRSHGPPLNNPGPEDARPYMSDSFDAIREGGNGTIVMFTIGYHFHHFDPDVYLRRIRIIKQSAISLLSRLPGSKVIVKGLHYHKVRYGSSPWQTYRFVVMLRHEFRDIKGVYFMENWDYTLLQKNPGFHPPTNILLGTIHILLTYLC